MRLILSENAIFLRTIMSDPTSQANYTEIFTEHCAFKWKVDFTNQKLSGSVTHDLHVAKDGVREVMFVDTFKID
jgi:leukotriene-A4 hydrolase